MSTLDASQEALLLLERIVIERHHAYVVARDLDGFLVTIYGHGVHEGHSSNFADAAWAAIRLANAAMGELALAEVRRKPR